MFCDKDEYVLPVLSIDLGMMTRLHKLHFYSKFESTMAQMVGLLLNRSGASVLEEVQFAIHTVTEYKVHSNLSALSYRALNSLQRNALQEKYPLISKIIRIFFDTMVHYSDMECEVPNDLLRRDKEQFKICVLNSMATNTLSSSLSSLSAPNLLEVQVCIS